MINETRNECFTLNLSYGISSSDPNWKVGTSSSRCDDPDVTLSGTGNYYFVYALDLQNRYYFLLASTNQEAELNEVMRLAVNTFTLIDETP